MNAFERMKAAAEDKAALYSSSNGGKKVAGEGTFYCALVKAEIGDNRAGTSKRAALTYRVLEIIEGSPEEEGREFSEYISENSPDEILDRKTGILYNEAIRGGVKESKLHDEDDDVIFDVLSTIVTQTSKYIQRDGNGEAIRAIVKRVKTDKMAENGKPYYNNYFNDDKLDEFESKKLAGDEDKPKKGKNGGSEQASPYKIKDED